MPQIDGILEKLEGTSVYDVLVNMEKAYGRIAGEQGEWYEKTEFTCPSGCGECCVNFEPDLFECEALYMSAWLLENQPETALQVAGGTFPFEREKACQFYNPDSDYHCSIYGGRPYICRLFGACSSYSKTGRKIWKPCKFYPSAALAEHKPPLEHRQYSAEETAAMLGAVPPAMSDIMQGALSFIPDSECTALIRDILPATIKKFMWLIKMNGNDNPNGTPNAPLAA